MRYSRNCPVLSKKGKTIQCPARISLFKQKNTHTFIVGQDALTSIAYIRNGDIAIGLHGDFLDSGSVKVYNSPELELIGSLGPVNATSLAYRSDGLLVAGVSNGTVRVWDQHLQNSVDLQQGGGEGWICVAFSGYDHSLAIGYTTGFVRVWSPNLLHSQDLLTGVSGRTPVAYNPYDGSLAAGLSNGTVRVWNQDREWLVDLDTGVNGFVSGITYTRDGSLAVGLGTETGAFHSGLVRVWGPDLQDFRDLSLQGHGPRIWTTVASSPYDGFLAAGLNNGTVRIWDENLTPIEDLDMEIKGMTTLSYSPYDGSLATGTVGPVNRVLGNVLTIWERERISPVKRPASRF